MNKVEKQEIIKEYQLDEKDSGSPEVQIAILSKLSLIHISEPTRQVR